jgi:hypothetical protein
MNVEIRTEAALFPEKEYISWIFLAVWSCLYASKLVEAKHSILTNTNYFYVEYLSIFKQTKCELKRHFFGAATKGPTA